MGPQLMGPLLCLSKEFANEGYMAQAILVIPCAETQGTHDTGNWIGRVVEFSVTDSIRTPQTGRLNRGIASQQMVDAYMPAI